MSPYETFLQVGIAVDPIHVGTGGARLGRVDLTIVRDPVSRLPKIPGSSLAGVYRSYVAMHLEEERQQQLQSGQNVRQKPYFPDCAGVGLDEKTGHCRWADCPVCTVFGFARGMGEAGGFAGLAAFSDAHILLFPVATRRGPMWITSPAALTFVQLGPVDAEEDVVYLDSDDPAPLNLGWLLLPAKRFERMSAIKSVLATLGIPDDVRNAVALVPDRLFSHIVNSNLEVRTSVSIDPRTGAAEEKALFSYEALPRCTLLVWEIVAKNPAHFRIGGKEIKAVSDPEAVHRQTRDAHHYLAHLGIGGMGTRGMGRIKVLYSGPFSQPTSASSTPG